MTDFKNVLLAVIKADPGQPRKFFDETAMTGLTQSVKEKGVLQPILLRPHGKLYLLVCGERRYRASVAAGLIDIPAVIRELSDEEALELQIIENLQRKDVHPMEEAVAFKSLMVGKQWTIQEVASRVGKSDFYVRQRLKLNDLVAEWQQPFYKNKFTLTDALQLCLLPEKAQKEFFKNEGSGDNIKINDYSINRYKGDLHKATFDLKDPTLDKKMGPCTTCQYNTAVSLLFPEHADSPRCMNVPCFKNKSDVFFDRELVIAKQDPSIVFVSTSGYYFDNKDLVEKLTKEGHSVLRQYNDYDSIDRPEKPDLQEYIDDNYDEGDEDSSLDEVKKDFEREVADYEKELAVFEKKSSSGKFIKAFVVDGRDTGAYIFIELRKKAQDKSSKAAVASGEASVSDIDDEITRMKEREERNKELDSEKVHAIVKDILSKSQLFRSVKRDCELIHEEITAAMIAMYEAGSYDFKKWFNNKFNVNTANYYLSSKDYGKLSTTTEYGMNEVIWHFIADKLIGNGLSPLKYASALAVHNIAKHYHPSEVSKAVSDQEAIATKRINRVDVRIAELQAKKKELTAAAKPPKKSKAVKPA